MEHGPLILKPRCKHTQHTYTYTPVWNAILKDDTAWLKSPLLGSQLTRLMSGSLVFTTLGRSTNINNGRTIIITYKRNELETFSSTLACKSKSISQSRFKYVHRIKCIKIATTVLTSLGGGVLCDCCGASETASVLLCVPGLYWHHTASTCLLPL